MKLGQRWIQEIARSEPSECISVAHTRSDSDDEELDVFVLSAEPIVPLTILRARVIGGWIETERNGDGPEDRLLAVAVDDPNVAEIRSHTELDRATREAFESFVRIYKQNEGVRVSFDRWYDREEAVDRLRRACEAAERRPAV